MLAPAPLHVHVACLITLIPRIASAIATRPAPGRDPIEHVYQHQTLDHYASGLLERGWQAVSAIQARDS